jgi:hypothetical protein
MTGKRRNAVASGITSDVPIVAEVRALIVSARKAVATVINASLTTLYWQIGTRIRRDILREKRAGYGEEILHTLSTKLSAEFGRGFSRSNLAYMVLFAELSPTKRLSRHCLENWAGATSLSSSRSTSPTHATSTRRCAA